eukprot:TRINITY_DN4182_c0_g1_i1.p1 TRINITY_DN4182_c0_g1~~TRINITY_DN4182_c0_g1_i1.p1  ORF type:complete len:252 (-),score=28.00 TRINITY_DN4182_c0_g1_i1:28-783(-)
MFHIPSGYSGLDAVKVIRSTLQPFGNISQFNVYLQISDTASLSAKKRSYLQLSGCHVIDTPHMNRKEVADKMIIVDALLYLINCKEGGATPCFITGDQDYAYLLSQLKAHTKFRTILVCQHATSPAVLESAADHVLSWYNDVLKITPPSPQQRPTPNYSERTTREIVERPLPSCYYAEEVDPERERVALLLSIIEKLQITEGPEVKRSSVGRTLLETYPQKFCEKEIRTETILRANEKGFVTLGEKRETPL